VEAVRAVLGDHEVVVVPEEPGIAGADREGAAPLDAAPGSAGVRALVALAERLGERAPGLFLRSRPYGPRTPRRWSQP
ncbi:MAG: hypothetical protein M3515_02905, partial [Actinomycetota bacterium]|nr:hypothetical protein [Actinomycetota bacterium]